MDLEAFKRNVERTLEKRVREAVTANLTGGVLMLAASAVTTFLGYWVAYFVLSLGLDWVIKAPPWLKSLLALAAVASLFVRYFRNPPNRQSEWTVSAPNESEKISLLIPHASLFANVDLMKPETMRSTVKILGAIPLAGPQLAAAGIEAMKRAGRLQNLDIPGCAAVIALFLGQVKRFSFEEICRHLPQVDARKVLPQLGNLEGVDYLQGDPPEVTLAADFRDDFVRACKPRIEVRIKRR